MSADRSFPLGYRLWACVWELPESWLSTAALAPHVGKLVQGHDMTVGRSKACAKFCKPVRVSHISLFAHSRVCGVPGRAGFGHVLSLEPGMFCECEAMSYAVSDGEISLARETGPQQPAVPPEAPIPDRKAKAKKTPKAKSKSGSKRSGHGSYEGLKCVICETATS